MSEIKTWRNKITLKGPLEDRYCDRVGKTLEKIDNTTLGKALITLLAHKGVDIEYMEKKCDFMPKGTAPRIYYDPDFLKKRTLLDPTLKTILKKQATFVYLYHELVHAARWATGKFIEAKGSTFAVIKVSTPEEFTVVGLYEYTGYSQSENEYRKSLGLPRRPFYLDDPTHEQFDDEVKRRMYLLLPDPPKYRGEELVFTRNRYNEKIDEWKLSMYVALDYDTKRKEFPKGYSDKGPPVPQDWIGGQ